jgi:hypothetical protein
VENALTISSSQLNDSLEVTSTYANFAQLTQMLHSGPKIKGQPRMQYDFNDGTIGNVYRGILLGITSDPIQKEFTYGEVYNRVRTICVNDFPTGQSISQPLTYMNNIVDKAHIPNSYFEWDEERLYVIDPYLAFYLRCSNKIAELGTPKPPQAA